MQSEYDTESGIKMIKTKNLEKRLYATFSLRC